MLSTHGYFDPIPQLGRTDTGGQVTYVLELAKALTTLGNKVDIYTRWFDQSKEQIDPVLDCPDVRVIRISAGSWEFLPKEFIYDVLPELADNMVKFIQENNLDYDLYHGHYVDAGIVTLDVAKALGKPAFFTAHSLGAWKRDQMGGDPEQMERQFKFKHRVAEEIRIFKEVNAQTLTTQLQLEKLNELYDYYADNIVIIEPGTDIHTYHPLSPGEKDVEITLPEKYVFCISRIDSNKGHDMLLNAFDIVRKEVEDVDLVIGGGSPNPKERELSLKAGMKKIVDECGMQDRVHIIGYVPDELMSPYYRQSRVFALPSLFEPFGMTTTEAMACGTPVVASKFGGIKTVINTGENGVLIDPTNTEEFATAIIDFLKDREKAERIGKAGAHTVKDYLSWEAIARRHLEFYDKFM
ncbi:MAG: glycosyltransferase [Deltaproteobacteria bacterium]|nr:glycosyltransferase [Deltaproteobacteria bacterium]MBW1736049.1 glycosyltransferase [Deltaproteobacteria bacterium]MBW1908474.1 glycosyltransferase [Deltaproteobacteria bacterium]MBW2032548.1 glycosyltransferase [Deltaproteobacteria bacterium]MBW2115698.1 glycosyltransferase [Deltaproteobacteria bacterium]